MYRRPKFLEVLLDIRQEMAREADYDVDLFAEMTRAGTFPDAVRRSIQDDEGIRRARRKRVSTGTE